MIHRKKQPPADWQILVKPSHWWWPFLTKKDRELKSFLEYMTNQPEIKDAVMERMKNQYHVCSTAPPYDKYDGESILKSAYKKK